MKVLFLCHGNINRSPAGEVILQHLAPSIEVRSAGFRDKRKSKIAKSMRIALAKAGYTVPDRRSQVVTEDDMKWADVVFYMDNGNKKRLYDALVFLQYAYKFIRLSDFIGEPKIPDPHFHKGTEMHEKVVEMLTRALRNWLNNVDEDLKHT